MEKSSKFINSCREGKFLKKDPYLRIFFFSRNQQETRMVFYIIQLGLYIIPVRLTLALSYLSFTTFGACRFRVTILTLHMLFLPSLLDMSQHCGHICRLPDVQFARSSVEDLAD